MPKQFTIVTSKITDHHNKCNSNEKFEISQELPDCDTETQSEQML